MQQATLSAADTTLQSAALVVESAVNRQFLQIDGALARLIQRIAAIRKRQLYNVLS
jgi:hypothetical protein